MNRINVLFVCMGNICRSPTADGIFFQLLEKEGLTDKIGVDSAGTHAYHVGEPPDPRAQSAALARGVDISHLRARKVSAEDFNKFDYILAMDYENLSYLQSICPDGDEHRLRLLLGFAPHLNVQEVPDPYYGGKHGFEEVLNLVEEASKALLQDIRSKNNIG